MIKDKEIVVTSTSERRIFAIEKADPNARVLSVPGSKVEEETSNLVAVAEQKVVDAWTTMLEEHDIHGESCVWSSVLRGLAHGKENVMAIAADTNNVAGGKEFFGKPSCLQEAQQMLSLTAQYGWYDIWAATAVKNGLFVSGSAKARVVLNEVGRKALASQGGQDQYLAYLAEKYDAEMYKNVSGALMIEALIGLNWIQSVDAVSLDSAKSDTELHRAANLSLTGFIPGILGYAHPAAAEKLARYQHVHEPIGLARAQRFARPQ